jgi:hypothetical protein
MKLLLNLILTIISIECLAQNQGNIWYFGEHAGVDFNSGTPIAINGGQTYNSGAYSEGTSSISDDSGNLIMYSNGEKVWNKNHLIMLNGDSLYGNYSSTHSSIIIPQPNSKNNYFLFTVDDVWESDSSYGFRYSVIDLCEDNGNGMVKPNFKNVLLLADSYEKVAAVRHSNGVDYWVIAHKLNTNNYYSFLLNQSGIANPIVSSVGSVSDFGQGQMKFSPNGNKMAVAHNQHWAGPTQFEVFDFDNSTGIFSNPISISTSSYYVYGIEFSPNSSVIYAVFSGPSSALGLKIMQYDLSSGTELTINSSQFTVYQTTWVSLRGLQLGPDNKIYMVGIPNEQYLLSISSPNTLGTGCNLIDNDIYLGGNSGNKTLPTFVAGYSYQNLNFSDCSLAIEDLSLKPQNRTLVRIIDLTGREIEYKSNTLMILVYDDGFKEKVFISEE